MEHERTAGMAHCIESCRDCSAECMDTVQHCLKLGGQHASADHIGLLMNCAAICCAAVDLMRTESRFHPQLCNLCAEVCKSCAEECCRIAAGDRTMEHCATTCDECAAACSEMAAATSQHR